MKNLRQIIRSGGNVIGSWINSGSPIIAEIMAQAGFDFLTVDVEHSAVDLPQTQQLFQAMQSGSVECAPWVRVHGADYSLVKRYVDAGARGVICPLVNTVAQAEQLVSAVRYPPLGLRGVGYCRGNQYGRKVTEEFKHADEEIVVVLQVEHRDAVDALEDLVKVKGIDAVFIGPYDLTASMGIAAQFDHPDFIQAKRRVIDVCRSAGIAVGIHVVQPESSETIQRLQEGYQIVAHSLDITMVMRACDEGLRAIRGAQAKAR